jgi:predicted AAA+ superfamily ATPase
MRYLTAQIQKDLRKKLVFLAGPRQVGKSTLATSLVSAPSNYLNWDVPTDRKIIRSAAWAKGSGLVVLDELHKFVKWKSFLKGVIDEYQNKPPILVTGSARLETFRKGGDALTGRTYMHRIHPIDPIEAVQLFEQRDALLATQVLLKTGGFPEAFLNPTDADRLREDRLQVVLREDLRDLSMVTELRGMALLVDLLRERVGGTVNYSNLAADIGVSPPTVKKWVELLERLYVIFLVYPHSRNLARSIRREPKVYFYDCAAAANGDGARFENLVGSCLLKWIHFFNDALGRRYSLQYFRDKDAHEVDFVVCEGLRPKIMVEAKLADSDLHPGLVYLGRMLPKVKGFQIVGAKLKERQTGQLRVMGVGAIDEVISEIETKGAAFPPSR